MVRDGQTAVMGLLFSCLQVCEHTPETHPAGAGTTGSTATGSTEWGHGDLPWHLSHCCGPGREPLPVRSGAAGGGIAGSSKRCKRWCELTLSPPSRALLDQVEHWQSFLALVNMIMFCTGIPGHYPVNETTSSLTLTFWYTLQVCPSDLQ